MLRNEMQFVDLEEVSVWARDPLRQCSLFSMHSLEPERSIVRFEAFDSPAP